MAENDYLPELARDIAEIIGLDGLTRLVNAFGGITIRVPGKGQLKNVLTTEQYKAFVHHFKNEKLAIPRLYAQQKQLINAETNRLLAEGYTKAEAARKMNVTERTIYSRQAKNKQQDTKQQDLF